MEPGRNIFKQTRPDKTRFSACHFCIDILTFGVRPFERCSSHNAEGYRCDRPEGHTGPHTNCDISAASGEHPRAQWP